MVSLQIARSTLAAAVLAMALTACGAQTIPGAASPAASAGSGLSDLASAENTARGATGPGVDACALVPAADVEALIGKNDGGHAAPQVGDGGSCVWTNTDNQYSVSVDIGATDTAANGLPALDPAVGRTEPLAGGMRYLAGAVEFAAKGRDCSAQVATNDTTAGGDKAAAVTLATAVTSRM